MPLTRQGAVVIAALATLTGVVGTLLLTGYPAAHVVAALLGTVVMVYGAIRVGIEYERRRGRGRAG